MTKTKAAAIFVAVVGSILYAKTAFFPDWGWEEHYQAGWTAHEKGEHGRVEAHFLNALKEAETFSEDDPRLHRSLDTLARYYQSEKKYAEAERFIQRVLALDEKILGPTHPNVAASLNNLAEIRRILGKYEEALPLYERALAIWQEALGPEDPLVLHIREIYADTLQKTGRQPEPDKPVSPAQPGNAVP